MATEQMSKPSGREGNGTSISQPANQPSGPLDETLRDIYQDVSREVRNALLQDVKFVVEDIRQQYRDHNQLLARQEMLVQQLLGQATAGSAAMSPRKSPRVVSSMRPCGPFTFRSPQALCAEPERTMTSDENVPEIVQLAAGESVQPVWAIGNDMTEPGIEFVFGKISGTTLEDVRRMQPRACPAPSQPPENVHPLPENTELSKASGGSSEHRSSSEAVARSPGDDDDIVAEIEVIADGVSPREEHSHHEFAPEKKQRRSWFKKEKKGKKPGGLFDSDLGMDRNKLDKEDYNVMNYYHTEGISQCIARSDIFANITLAVIAMNTVYIGIDADNNKEENIADAETGFQICENLFCVFFTFEWMVRFGAFKRKAQSMKDNWFKFDSGLVALMVAETWFMPIAFAGSGGTGIPTGLVKMLRLLRLARMARLMRSFPELIAMIKGVKVASRAVGSALMMLTGLVYVFAIIMFTLLKDAKAPEVHERFSTLGFVMWTLLIDGTFMDSIGFVSRSLIENELWVALVVLMLFVLGSALTVMNMLIGVLCEVVSAVAAAEKEDAAIRIVKDKLLVMLKEMDEDNSGRISRSEIQQVLDNNQALSTLESLEVDVNYLMEQLDMQFEDGEDLTIHAIMDLILMLRGDRAPTMRDMLQSNNFNRWKLRRALALQTNSMESWFANTVKGLGIDAKADDVEQMSILKKDFIPLKDNDQDDQCQM